MLKTPQFYMMYASFVMMGTGFLLATANLAPIARSWGLTAAAVTLAATFSPVANGASRVFWGWASDTTGRENAMILAFTLNAACLLSAWKLGQVSGAWFAFSLVLVYFTGGQIYSLFPSTTADYFGTTHATSNYAVLHRQGRRGVHRGLRRTAALRAVRQLGCVLLRERGARAHCRGVGVWSACIGDGSARRGRRRSCVARGAAPGTDRPPAARRPGIAGFRQESSPPPRSRPRDLPGPRMPRPQWRARARRARRGRLRMR